MTDPTPPPDSLLGPPRPPLDALLPAQEQAPADLTKAEQAAVTQLAGRQRPPRELRRQVQRDRDRVQTRLATLVAEIRQVEADLMALRERLAVVQAELAQLDQRDDPVTAGMTIAQYSERYFALRRELRDLVGGEAETIA